MICKTPVFSHCRQLPRVQATVCGDKDVGVLKNCLVAHFVLRELSLEGVGNLSPAPMGIITRNMGLVTPNVATAPERGA